MSCLCFQKKSKFTLAFLISQSIYHEYWPSGWRKSRDFVAASTIKLRLLNRRIGKLSISLKGWKHVFFSRYFAKKTHKQIALTYSQNVPQAELFPQALRKQVNAKSNLVNHSLCRKKLGLQGSYICITFVQEYRL